MKPLNCPLFHYRNLSANLEMLVPDANIQSQYSSCDDSIFEVCHSHDLGINIEMSFQGHILQPIP